MGRIKDKLLQVATHEWVYFGRSTRTLDDDWAIASIDREPPHTHRVGDYWDAVDRPDWDGKTAEPWSAAFISWCFAEAGAGECFWGDDTHSVYVDRIRRHDRMSERLVLLPPEDALIEVGDLIWNSRGDDPPQDYTAAVTRLATGDFFPSHVDIVVAVQRKSCDSIGGNVSDMIENGSVTRSSWTLQNGRIADPRKTWIGVVKNGL